MKLPRRNFLLLAAGAGAVPAVSRIAGAQTYPTRPVRLVVGYTAGGGNDITARLMAQWLSERLGQQFIVDNRPGAGSNIAAEAVVRAPADGHTLLLAGAPNAINVTFYDKLNFNFARDVAPITSTVHILDRIKMHLVGKRPFRSSSPMPRPIPEISTWGPPAPEAPTIWPASCSR